jgi:hypothetical protein
VYVLCKEEEMDVEGGSPEPRFEHFFPVYKKMMLKEERPK